MKITQLLVTSTLALVALARPSPGSAKPDVDVSVKFPDNNAFGRVLNGASNNLLNVRLDNHGTDEIVVSKIYGEYYEPHGKERVLRKTTISTIRESVPGGSKSRPIVYRFHSENKIGEIGLRVFIEYLDAKKKVHKVIGYENAVTIVEQPGSWFDPALLFTYFVISCFLGFVSYLVYGAYFEPTLKKGTGNKKSRTSTSTTSTTSSIKKSVQDGKTKVEEKANELVNGVDESWLPDHIVRQRKKEAANSGSESEGAKKARKAKK